MKNTYPMNLTTPRLKTKITIEDLDGDIVMSIPGFGRWMMDEEGPELFAIGFLPAEEKELEFESLAFFWHDWLEDVMNTRGIHGDSLQYEYAMYHIGDKVNVIY